MMRDFYSTLLILTSVFAAGVFSGCKSTESPVSQESAESAQPDENASKSRSAKSKGAAAGEKSSSPPVVKNSPSPQSTVEYATTTLSNEDTFAGQIPQPKLEDVLRDMEQAYRERNDDGGALISYLVFRRLYGNSRDFLSVLEKRGSTASSRDPWILLECSYTALLRNDYGMAQYLLDSAEAVGKGKSKVNAAVLHARGLMFYMQKKVVLAMATFREAAKLSYEPAILTLSFFALKAGDHDGALIQLNKLKDSASGNINVKAALGIAYRQAGKPDEALEYLNAVVRARPNDKRVLWNAALAMSEVPSKRKSAIATLEKYNSMPGSLLDVDSKVRNLLSKLETQEAEEANKAKPDVGEANSGSGQGGGNAGQN
jgi:tetratricopeptide (TPR) repeat protein